jgi:hypothetical protein
MTFVFKQCTQHRCSNNKRRWMTSMFVSYEVMKSKFRMIITAKSLPIKFVTYMSFFFYKWWKNYIILARTLNMSTKHQMHGILPLDYMRKWINALWTLVEVIMVRHITNLTSHDLNMKIVQNSSHDNKRWANKRFKKQYCKEMFRSCMYIKSNIKDLMIRNC